MFKKTDLRGGSMFAYIDLSRSAGTKKR